jgi:1-pyrroline-5-carboxylate dehydrogenase
MVPYRPEPFTNFGDSAEEAKLKQAIAAVTRKLGSRYPLWIGGRPVDTARRIVSINPSDGRQIIGESAKADALLAERAVAGAHRAYAGWSRTAPERRSEYLLKAAALLRQRKAEFTAWLMLEAGKSRAEADADAAEAIDFLEYYARQIMDLVERGRKSLTALPGEKNELAYIPLGVGVIIAPWNFPLAILAGMTAAAVVSGNTVVVKPSSLTPIVAYKFVELMQDAGLPEGVISLTAGDGSVIGDVLVEHPLTRFIAFTGSREVGVRIHALSAHVQPGQRWLKRFIGELGGKDAILVDQDADLEAASRAIVSSAFGYAGQKCSACSRAIVHRAVYREVLDRTVELTRGLKVGGVLEDGIDVGPVIDEAACTRILGYFELARREGKLVLGGRRIARPGYYLEPTIAADVPSSARIMQEEVFGPLLAFTPCEDFEDGLRIANDTEYGLTGAAFSNNRAHLARATAEFHVGNLYLNRRCTGAIVGVHPFGGFDMSGTDSKAGGPDYLMQFTQAKLTSELL